MEHDVIVVGAGIAGLVAAAEAADRGLRVAIVDQEPEQSLGGQAFWSLGGLFMVDTPEQRRLRVRDSAELAWSDWQATATFDRDEDHWPRQWAKAYIEFAAGEMHEWLSGQGMTFFPVVSWAERGAAFAGKVDENIAFLNKGKKTSIPGQGNSVPRFHIAWGTGPGVIEPFVARVLEHVKAGQIKLYFRYCVTSLSTVNGAVTGVSGDVLEPDGVARGESSNRELLASFALTAVQVIVCSGGMGGDVERVRANWPTERIGPAPATMIAGVPQHVDGKMLDVAEQAGARLINTDRMWHYTEGVKNWNPIWPSHGIRILPGPSSMWFDAEGRRLPFTCLPGFDTLGTLKHICQSGYDYSWFVLTQKIIEKEFALSGSEQNPDITSKRWFEVLKTRLGKGATPNVEAFKQHGEDFLVADSLPALIEAMNASTEKPLLSLDEIHKQIDSRDENLMTGMPTDLQISAIRKARGYLGDKLVRTAKPHAIMDPDAGPLIAVKLHILTRKSLGGIHTDLQARVLDHSGQPIPGLYAAGEVAGFGGGGYHGYAALEGTFLGGCIFSGRIAGRSVTL